MKCGGGEEHGNKQLNSIKIINGHLFPLAVIKYINLKLAAGNYET